MRTTECGLTLPTLTHAARPTALGAVTAVPATGASIAGIVAVASCKELVRDELWHVREREESEQHSRAKRGPETDTHRQLLGNAARMVLLVLHHCNEKK